MVAEFVQIFALLFAVATMLALFYLLAVRREGLMSPFAVFLVLVAFLSLVLSYLSARIYIPIQVNATAVRYYQDPYGIGFLSVVMSLISLFLALAILFTALANQGARLLRL
jgi:ABC-type Fe3+-siderophore transport system permease subunit